MARHARGIWFSCVRGEIVGANRIGFGVIAGPTATSASRFRQQSAASVSPSFKYCSIISPSLMPPPAEKIASTCR